MVYAKRKAISLVGKVCDAPSSGVSKNGKRYARLPVQDVKSSKIYVLMAFDELSKILEARKINEQISVRGNKDPEEDTIFVNTIAQETVPVAHFIDPAKNQAKQKYAREYMREHDFVPVLVTNDLGENEEIWVHKEQCVKIDDFEWKRKIDYLIEHPNCGPTKIRAAMCEVMKGSTALSKEGGTKIRELVDKMVLENLSFSPF